MPDDAVRPALTIQKFEKALHDRSAFSCGLKAIDNFLASSLSGQIKDGMVAAYMATADGDPAVLGFYTLGAMAVRSDYGPKKWQRASVPDIPVIYLRAIAVRGDQQGKGLGTALVIDALRRSAILAESMGTAAVVLDVLHDANFDRRCRFYDNLGFRPLNDPENPNRMYITMADVVASLS